MFPIWRIRFFKDAKSFLDSKIAESKLSPLTCDNLRPCGDCTVPTVKFATRVDCGLGEAAFNELHKRLLQLKMFDLPWLKVTCSEIPARLGSIVLVRYDVPFISVWNATRITELVEHTDENERTVTLTLGTLGHHVLRGEERFTVSYEKESERCTFEIASYSLTAWPFPLNRLFRRFQRRFLIDAPLAMCGISSKDDQQNSQIGFSIIPDQPRHTNVIPLQWVMPGCALLVIFSIPLSVIMYAGGTAALSGLVIIGGLGLLQLPFYWIVRRHLRADEVPSQREQPEDEGVDIPDSSGPGCIAS